MTRWSPCSVAWLVMHDKLLMEQVRSDLSRHLLEPEQEQELAASSHPMPLQGWEGQASQNAGEGKGYLRQAWIQIYQGLYNDWSCR